MRRGGARTSCCVPTVRPSTVVGAVGECLDMVLHRLILVQLALRAALSLWLKL